jgi:hypothetical protein
MDALNVGGAQELLVLLDEKTLKSAYRTLVCVTQPDTNIRPQIELKKAPAYCFNRSKHSIYNPPDFILYLYKTVETFSLFANSRNWMWCTATCRIRNSSAFRKDGGCIAQIA